MAALRALLLAMLSACAPSVSTQAPEAAPAERLDWGMYRILWSRDYAKRIAAEVSKYARPPRYVMFYRDLGRGFPQSAIEAIHAQGAVPIVSLELAHWHESRTPRLPAILAGEYDDFFRAWAHDAREDGRPVLLRFGFEANGDWFSWGGDPERYVAAWRRAHAIFAEERADNVKWVWSPNIQSVPDTPDNSMHRYHPGDAFTDWVALDGYNWGDGYDEWHHWESFEGIFGAAVAELARRHPGKPIMIAETSSAPGPPGGPDEKAAWIRDAWEAARNMPGLRAVVWFDLDKRREGELDWRIESSPEGLAAFNASFAAPRESYAGER